MRINQPALCKKFCDAMQLLSVDKNSLLNSSMHDRICKGAMYKL